MLGIANYDNSAPLKNTVADAQAIAERLRALNFEVQDFYDLDFNNLLYHMTAFLRPEPNGEKLDAIMIYYAGHGIQLGDKNYIVPKDFNPHATYPLAQLVSVQMLLERMDDKADKKLLFLDACRDTGGLKVTNAAPVGVSAASLAESAPQVRDELNLVDAPVATRSLGGKAGLARPSLGHLNQTFIAFAADPGEKALDGPADGNSPFTEGVLSYIDRRGFDIFDMCQCAARDVRKATKGAQVPWTNSNLIDQFEFLVADRWPELVLGIMGVIAGVLTALFAFDLFDFKDGWLAFGNGRVADIGEHPQYLLTSLFLGAALGIGAYLYAKPPYRYAKPSHRWFVLVATCVNYALFAILSRLMFAPIVSAEKQSAALAKLDLEIFRKLVVGQADLANPSATLLIAVLFFAILAGGLTGAGSVLAAAPFHHEMWRAYRVVCGALIGMSAPVIFFLFLFVRRSMAEAYGWDLSAFQDGVADYREVIGIIILVALWQGALAWNVGRAYAKPRYDDT